MPAMLWDIFCRVIDNFGDIGVCWRLSADLAERGHQVRLWVDDASALAWMSTPHPHIAIHSWNEAEHQPPAAGDVVVESFGCDPPPAFVLGMHRAQAPVWVNLEYLSAEDYVERSHGLMSPIWSGAGSGLKKWFFYPGFTERTGGLLRERDGLARRAAFLSHKPSLQDWLGELGLAYPQGMDPEQVALSTKVSVFCYASAPVSELLDQILVQLQHKPEASVTLLTTPGHATTLTQAWQAQHAQQMGDANQALRRLHCIALPLMTQTRFDELLWISDLNLVRGEDSAVRALWAGRPHIWQIYEQDDGVHADKLHAFTQKWMNDWPADTRPLVAQAWDAWNNLGDKRGLEGLAQALTDAETLLVWQKASMASHEKLAKQPDLTTQLLEFVCRSG